jgi:hypothetical protein
MRGLIKREGAQVSINPSKPHFTVMLDEAVGDEAALSVTAEGEIICTMHPSAADDNSAARFSGHVMFRKAVEIATEHCKKLAAAEATA